MSDVRRQVREHVRTNPGVHFNELARNLDIATGQAQYHLRRLGRSDEVVAEHIRGRTHYFDPEYDAWERRTLALYRRETARDIITLLLEAGTLSAAAIAERLELARSTVSWHVDTLADADIVDQSYGARGQVEVTLAHPEETIQFLETVTPSLADTLVDRFVRLVDGGLHSPADD
ncbi:winged helix-turn-helix transcriptional regulator [Haloplanus aerogenes]|uniref:Winged helix-turn-helix DNA-binding protein n=1 Tax=Haloplanus aerogenes TaxID=660522 RepID=A0A3M0DTZ3_9EURY|nr:winged helix-turn-helix transcriptional regulator [Haloplanus aerogenes]AZH25656.1 winged helix-turn-helix transcriptional regulator [Haloplanus aerogenes]RMB25385.1 winged helix-turn-helix DNA-binding protein [Haloplanus aerogenes]